MILKAQIQERLLQISEIRHAESVYRDIVEREKERKLFEKRWLWELLQNAKDSVEITDNIKVKIEISDDKIAFSHNGNPFELDDILSLIIQGSSKNNKQNKTGRFGTGFMTTYLLSKEVQITGQLTNNDGYFQFLLNRNATDTEHFVNLQRESNEQLKNSLSESSYLADDEFQTKFTYILNEKGKETAKIGLQNLDELIPIAQLFSQQIESVVIVKNGNAKTFSKSLINTLGSIYEWEISKMADGNEGSTLKAYVYRDETFEASIFTLLENNIESVLPLTKNHPRLFFTFPLIGTEEIGVPIIINSTLFDPKIERDGIYLDSELENNNVLTNKEIIRKALIVSLPAYAELFKSKNISSIYELFEFGSAKDLPWIDHEWFNRLKSETIEILSSKEIINYHNSSSSLTSLNDLTIPYADSESNRKKLWDLFSVIIELKVPISNELVNWVQIADSVTKIKRLEIPYKLKFVWGIDQAIKFVEAKEDYKSLSSSLKSHGYNWLNNLYSLIDTIKKHFPLDIKICLNQRGEFRKAEGINWDKFKDDDLIYISKLIESNFDERLIAREITSFQISGVKDFNLQDAIKELQSKLNSYVESSFNSNPILQECSAKFIKWLISNNNIEVIKDLKVLTGASKKTEDNFIYDHFPKTEHLLLSPKPYFERNFPIYSTLIRDKDCLNEIYYQYLNDFDFTFLNKNLFIHLNPIIIKTESATIKILDHLIINENDRNLLIDPERGQLKYTFKVTYSDFAYMTASDGHIYDRNKTQKSSLERLKFLLNEAVETDPLFDMDQQEIKIEGMEKSIYLNQCRWVYRAKQNSWVNIKVESEGSEPKFISETPSSKNLSELLKIDETLVKIIRGSRQQNLLNKLGVGVSDLIRNTLPTDELRISWDKAITNMITSDADPDLVQEIFNDPSIKQEYERKINERKLINRNQAIGKHIEVLFKEYISKLKDGDIKVDIKREPFGSDYILTDESSDLVNDQNQREGFKINNWLVELKATGKEHASMTPLQAETATLRKDNYALIVVPLDGTDPNIEYLKTNAKVISNIGYKIEKVFSDFIEMEGKQSILTYGHDGISVNIEDQNIRFRVSSIIWKSEQTNIETFIRKLFIVNVETKNESTLG